jgi:glutaminyl-peptide cyclotransferase
MIIKRHLAESWETSLVNHPNKIFKNRLDQIEVMVLLDLMGVENVQFPNFYRSTSWLYYKLMGIEKRLGNQSILKTVSAKTGNGLISLFNPNSILTFRGEAIGDDHVPFLMRGVNVLHMIPHPFPNVWHNRLVNIYISLCYNNY